jgi:hypothetical protein
MALPDVTITILDGQLGLVPASVANASAKIGVSSLGTVNTVYPINDNGTAASTLGVGPLVDATAHTLSVAGGPVYAMPVNASVAGTTGAVSPAASGLAAAGAANDNYAVVVTIVTGGALGAAIFTYSLDGGDNVSGQILVPSGGTYLIPNTGVTLTFSGTLVTGQVYTFATTSPGYSNTDLTNALTALNNGATEYGFVHIVGMTASAAAAATTCAVIQTAMEAARVAYRYVFAIQECPTNGSGASTEADSVVAAAFAAVVADRVSVVAGDAEITSPLTGRAQRRNGAWVYSARLALIPASESPARVGRGTLTGVTALYGGSDRTLLDAARFTTLRSFPGYAGYYIARGNMMAAPGSDFSRVERRRVMDVSCRIVRQAELPFLNGPVRITKEGKIDERDAQAFEGMVNAKLKAGVVDTGDASSSTVVMNRSANILSTTTAPVEVRIVPLGTMENISTRIGFSNPALAA